MKTVAFSAPYAVPATGLYYAGVIAKGATRQTMSRTVSQALMAPSGIGSGEEGAHMAPIPRDVIVDDRGTSHLDPLSAAPKTNRFLKTVVPFLKRSAR